MKKTRKIHGFACCGWAMAIPVIISILTAVPNSNGAMPKGISSQDWAGIRSAHEATKYSIKNDEHIKGEWHATNPVQSWSIHFDGEGFITSQISAQKGDVNSLDWNWGLALTSYGYEGEENEIKGKANVKTKSGRVDYIWDENVTEWFVNDRHGLEHGYTIQKQPDWDEQKTRTEKNLIFHLQIIGGLQPTFKNDAKEIQFEDEDGTPLVTYSGLKVWDASGRILPSFFRMNKNAETKSLEIVVNDRDALYPVTIDPIAQQAYIKASNTGADDYFGQAVAISNDTVVVGAIGEDGSGNGIDPVSNNNSSASGAVYIFVRSSGSWTQQAYIKASNNGANDYFGSAVAISGDTVVVGAWAEDGGNPGINSADNNSATDAGAAYIFVRSGSTWSEQARIKSSNIGAGDGFGTAVSISGDTVAVSANGESGDGHGNNNNFSAAGAVYIFNRSGSTWSEQAYIKASNAGVNDLFGTSVCIDSDTLIVGAYGEDGSGTGVNPVNNNSASASGAAYVFVRSGTTWSQQALLKASNTGAGDNFGISVSIFSDTAVVGAYGEDGNGTGINPSDNNGSADSGAVYVFTRSGTTWSQQAYVKASNSGVADYFGYSTSIANDTLVVGAYGEDGGGTGANPSNDNTVSGSGAAYVFVRSSGTWSQQVYLKASNTGVGDVFGVSSAISGDTIVVGANYEDGSGTGVNPNSNNLASNAGAAFIFTGLGP